MYNLMGIKPVHGRIDYSIDDPRVYVDARVGDEEETSRSAMFFLQGGEGTEEGTAVVSIAHYQPGHTLPPHSHNTDYFALVVRGSIRIGARTYKEGDIRVQEAGAVYGPEHVGEDGLVQLVVMATRKGLPMNLTRERDKEGAVDMQAFLQSLADGMQELPPTFTVLGGS